MAEGIGCYAEFVDEIDDLLAAIKQAKDSQLPAVVHVAADKEANLKPPGSDLFEIVSSGA